MQAATTVWPLRLGSVFGRILVRDRSMMPSARATQFPRALRRLKKISGASRRGSLTFAITSPSVHSVQRPENINNLYPSLRLDGKASGQTLTEIGRI